VVPRNLKNGPRWAVAPDGEEEHGKAELINSQGLKLLLDGFSLQRPRFEPRVVYVRILVEKVVLGHFFLERCRLFMLKNAQNETI
jgi:hypothetical protein